MIWLSKKKDVSITDSRASVFKEVMGPKKLLYLRALVNHSHL